ncbi:MerR family transcriptional regulator [Actinoplanes awajinensis]|uniref:MerR family transcriptional regulator n=1 Tax=Actinoplanes awajinensis TaxID=135946 RepID=UPI0008345212|nr:MerR family transcriptional regulator [Actinoplanes awajinensis]
MLSIGAFARVTRLSPKALRLYDKFGLLRPAVVDEASGYRFYAEAQLEQARLIAWLRRLGMPLAEIQRVCALPPESAAEAVARHWEQVEAETAARARLAGFLIDHLAGRAAAAVTLGLRCAASARPGPLRDTNDDFAYAGSRLLAVADGMRGHRGDQVGEAAIGALKPLETLADLTIPADDLLGTLAEAVREAERAIAAISEDAVTTLTALFWSGSRLALAHIGDTRAYRLRDGELGQITHDHTYVQELIDDGRLTTAEAAVHPQRALLVHALTPGGGDSPDLSMHDARAGDRYLLCTDGLSTVVPAAEMCSVLSGPADPQQAVGELIGRAYRYGAPDNVAVVVADVVRLDPPSDSSVVAARGAGPGGDESGPA